MITHLVAASTVAYQAFWLLVILSIPLALYFVTLAVKQLARETVLDAIQVYQSWHIVRADIDRRRLDDQFEEHSRRLKLEVWQRQARAQIKQQKDALQLSSAALWKAGVFDIEIDEASR